MTLLMRFCTTRPQGVDVATPVFHYLALLLIFSVRMQCLLLQTEHESGTGCERSTGTSISIFSLGFTLEGIEYNAFPRASIHANSTVAWKHTLHIEANHRSRIHASSRAPLRA
ncbi:hypothetical protein GE09DRAFT_762512 [Coniochaeta sp. 2T2.1]|nr:hypothetical protein GE09DRAFT_762512 [Coniochaeta sp. 2T2.1]